MMEFFYLGLDIPYERCVSGHSKALSTQLFCNILDRATIPCKVPSTKQISTKHTEHTQLFVGDQNFLQGARKGT